MAWRWTCARKAPSRLTNGRAAGAVYDGVAVTVPDGVRHLIERLRIGLIQ